MDTEKIVTEETLETPQFVEIKEKKPRSIDSHEAPIKKEFLLPIIPGEKRKQNPEIGTGGKQNKNRAKKNKLDPSLKETHGGKPLQTGESNFITSDIGIALSRGKYPFPKHDEILKNVTTYAEAYTDFKNNLIKQLNREKMAEYVPTKYKPSEVKKVDFKDKTYLAPLTTVGNLPFRRICKEYGVDITCSEMALTRTILDGKGSELALLKRHVSEDVYGVQIAGGNPSEMIKIAEFIENEIKVDFVDINSGCPIDLLCKSGCGSALMLKKNKMHAIIRGMKEILTIPLSVKMRTGYNMDKPIAHQLFPLVQEWGADAVTLHGRSREQRYSNLANWDYIKQVRDTVTIPMIGNGDIMSWEDYERCKQSGVDSIMVGRGALMKPWVFKEIKEKKVYDISSKERFDMMHNYVKYGLDHWGSDDYGIERTRLFLLEWMSFLYRYIPVGLLEVLPQRINQRPPSYFGRDELETKMASDNVKDWIEITELFPELGKVKDGFNFTPKHKSNSYQG